MGDERPTWPFLNGLHYPDKLSYGPRKRHRVIAVNFIIKMGRRNASRYGESIAMTYRDILTIKYQIEVKSILPFMNNPFYGKE